jgi:hypothetical protein
MSSVATAAKVYYEENGDFLWDSAADINTVGGFQTTLGVSVPIGAKYISAGQIEVGNGRITFTVTGINATVDGDTITLTPDTSAGGINWVWGGSLDAPYMPKK